MKLESSQVSKILEDAGIRPLSCQDESKLGMVVRIRPEDNAATLTALRDCGFGFEMLVDTFGADMGDPQPAVPADPENNVEAKPAKEGGIEVTYYLLSMRSNVDIRVKCRLPYGAVYQSVIDVFKSVLFPERELCEMYGLVLEGHPNPKRLLTNVNYINPLLKSTPIRGKEEVWNRS